MNGWELDELHNVYINPSTVANNDILVYSSGTTLWQNKNIYTAIGNATTSTTGLLTSANWNTFNAKLDNNAWVDYSATSTIVGWSSFTAKILKYKIVGNMMFVNYGIYGTSNSATTSFTLPNNAVEQAQNGNRTQNNGVWYHGNASVLPASNVVNFNWWNAFNSTTSTFTASGTKIIYGQLYFEI
jgi:hypothetical protein